jgi:hypothetical protein
VLINGNYKIDKTLPGFDMLIGSMSLYVTDQEWVMLKVTDYMNNMTTLLLNGVVYVLE